MNDRYNAALRSNARQLRKNMTKEERHLWYDFLKELPLTVKRQKILGNYIADFYIASASVVIELDGSQHYEAEGLASDKARDEYFNSQGIRVLRYSNLDVNKSFPSVCEDILRHLNVD